MKDYIKIIPKGDSYLISKNDLKSLFTEWYDELNQPKDPQDTTGMGDYLRRPRRTTREGLSK